MPEKELGKQKPERAKPTYPRERRIRDVPEGPAGPLTPNRGGPVERRESLSELEGDEKFEG